MILTHTIKVEDLTAKVYDADKEGYDTITVSSLNVNIQPASSEKTVLYEGVLGNTFTMYAPPTASGIDIGARVTVISGSNLFNDIFTVRGREDWNFQPLPHYEFTLFRD